MMESIIDMDDLSRLAQARLPDVRCKLDTLNADFRLILDAKTEDSLQQQTNAKESWQEMDSGHTSEYISGSSRPLSKEW